MSAEPLVERVAELERRVAELEARRRPVQGGADGLVGIAEAERLTGRHRSTLYRAYRAGELVPPIFVGERRKWKRSALLAWVESQAARPASARRGAANLGARHDQH